MEGHAKNDLFFYTQTLKSVESWTQYMYFVNEQFLNIHGSGYLLYKTLSLACQKQSTPYLYFHTEYSAVVNQSRSDISGGKFC